MAEIQVVDAVRGTTMEDGVKLHNKPLWQQIKDVLFVDEKGKFILSIIRGDFDVNETKLKKLTHSIELRHATDEEIHEKFHSEPGFISPVGIKEIAEKDINFVIVADDSLRTIVNAYGGANALNKDTINMNIDRDYQADIEGDIALAKEGYEAVSGGILTEKKGIEIGNIFQLGYHYTTLMKGSNFTDRDGKRKPYYMGCYGIGVGRTMATIVEKYHTEKGIQWPVDLAPYQVEIIGLDLDNPEIMTKAEAKYQELLSKGVDVLFDDRIKTTTGEKFADADLIGATERIVISKREN
jgi:prolyl-tRNA synthetase